MICLNIFKNSLFYVPFRKSVEILENAHVVAFQSFILPESLSSIQGNSYVFLVYYLLSVNKKQNFIIGYFTYI